MQHTCFEAPFSLVRKTTMGENRIRVYFCRNAVGGTIPAALSELEHRPDVALEAVPCAGRIDPRYLLKAFEAGARAVCILACPVGCCKSMEGNLRAVARVHGVQELLCEAGISRNSLRIFLPRESGEAALNAAAESISKFANEVT